MGERHLLALVSAIMALTAVAIDMMLPAFDDIRVAFDLRDGSADTGRIVTVFFLGLALAQMVYGPLADRFGRKPTLYLGIGVYLAGAIGSALAPNFELLLVSRFVWGVGAAGSRVVAIAIVRDRFEGNAMARAMSQVMAVFVLVPILAPAIGAGVIAVFPWRGIFWACVIFAAVVTVWSLRLDETLPASERRPLSITTTWRGFVDVVRTPVTSGYTLASVFLQAVFTAYLASSEVIISEIFGRRDEFPFVFGSVAILFGAGALLNGRIVERVGIDRVVTLVFGALAVLCSVLVLLAVAGDGVPSFWLFMPVLGLILGSFMFLLPNLNAAAMAPMGHIAGTASAATGAVRIALGAVLGTIVSNQVVASVTPFAVGLTVFVAAAGLSVLAVRTLPRLTAVAGRSTAPAEVQPAGSTHEALTAARLLVAVLLGAALRTTAVVDPERCAQYHRRGVRRRRGRAGRTPLDRPLQRRHSRRLRVGRVRRAVHRRLRVARDADGDVPGWTVGWRRRATGCRGRSRAGRAAQPTRRPPRRDRRRHGRRDAVHVVGDRRRDGPLGAAGSVLTMEVAAFFELRGGQIAEIREFVSAPRT